MNMRWRLHLVLVSLALMGFGFGCSRQPATDPAGNPTLAATGTPGADQALVHLSFTVDPAAGAEPRPSVRASASEPSSVAVTFITVNVGNRVQPVTRSTVTATPDENRRVAITQVLPAKPTIAQVHVASGTIGSYTDFRGALDLVPGVVNNLAVQPSGSRMPQDVIAQVLEHIVETPTRFDLAGMDLAARALTAIAGINRTLELDLVYAAALDATQRQLAVGRGTGSVSGTVFTETTSGSERGSVRLSPAAGAQVYVEQDPSITATVDTNGRFLLAGVREGRCNIIADDDKGPVAGRFRTRSPEVAVVKDQTADTGTLQTAHAPNYIEGYVTDDRTNQPVAGVIVTVWGQVSTSGTNGYYKVFNMPQGTWDVQYEKMGYQTKIDRVSFGIGQSTSHHVAIHSLDTFAPIISEVQITVTETTARLIWRTNEPAVRQVDYGTTEAYGSINSGWSTTPSRDHDVTLSYLTRGTRYYVRLKGRDAVGNVGMSSGVTFTTLDQTAPMVANVLVSDVDDTSFRVSFTTNEAAIGEVLYGPTTAYGSVASSTLGLAASHSITVTGLTPSTQYQFRVRAVDASGNLTSGTTGSVRTRSTPPVVTGTTPSNTNRPTWTWTGGAGGNGNFRIKLDDPNLATGYISTNTPIFTPATALTDGPHTLYVTESNGYDQSLPGSFTIVVDAPPLPPVVAAASWTANLRPTWTWTSGGGGSGTYRVKVDDADLRTGATEVTATSYTPATALTPGSHTLFVQEIDGSGQWSAAGSRPLNIGLAVTTLAGSYNQLGSLDGTGAAARFNEPFHIAAAPDGSFVVTDSKSHKVRRITLEGVVTTVAGSGVSGSTDGPANTATFNTPYGVAVGADGTIYVTSGHAIRKIDTAGNVTTLAGNAGTSGTLDQVGTAARFYSPRGLLVESSGDLLVADYANHAIRRVAPDGTVTTVAGVKGSSGAIDGPAVTAKFYNPESLAVDAAGNIYVADVGNDAIRKIGTNGDVTTFAGALRMSGSTDGPLLSARFNGPCGIALDAAGNLWVGESSSYLIRRISPDGQVTTVAGQTYGYADGIGANARFYPPRSLAVSADGAVLITDTTSDVIRRGGFVP